MEQLELYHGSNVRVERPLVGVLSVLTVYVTDGCRYASNAAKMYGRAAVVRRSRQVVSLS